MNKILGLLLIFVFLANSPVFAEDRARVNRAKLRHEQRLEMEDFNQQQDKEDEQVGQDIKQLPPAQRSKAIKEYLEKQHSEEAEFLKKQHKENTAFLKAKISASSKMTEEQKNDMINFFESQYQEKVSLKEQKYRENITFFEKIANDPGLTIGQKKEAINTYLKAQSKETKEVKQEGKSATKEEPQKVNALLNTTQEAIKY